MFKYHFRLLLRLLLGRGILARHNRHDGYSLKAEALVLQRALNFAIGSRSLSKSLVIIAALRLEILSM